MAGGDHSVLEQVKKAILPYAKAITLMGPVGSGQMTKMVNQILIAGVLQGISEGLTLARKSELDLPKVIKAVSGGAAGSWQLSNNGQTIIEDKFDFGFAIDWMIKDLGFCLESAEALALNLPNTLHAMAEYKKLQAKGYHRCDTSVLIKQFDD
jgi:3-hydroxyisobutyrate dehydrogenase